MEILIAVATAGVLAVLALALSPIRTTIADWLTRNSTPSAIIALAETHLWNVPDYRYEGTPQFFFPAPLTPPSPFPGKAVIDWREWLVSAGGIDSGHTVALVTVQATRETTVVVDPPELVWSRRDVPEGINVSPEGLGGGGVSRRRYSFWLESGIVSRAYLDADTQPDQPNRDGLPESYSLGKGESQRLLIDAFFRDPGYYEWSLRLPTVENGKRRTLSVAGSDGKPFVTIAASIDQSYFYDVLSGTWVKS